LSKCCLSRIQVS